MFLYSLALLVGLVVASPWWLLRMATTERYRKGLWERLGSVPRRLTEGIHGYGFRTKVVWIHTVSVGEVLAATRLVGELEAALGEGWGVVVSTTTRTGQALAQERFGAERVFYYPLDFAWAVRAYLRALRPGMLVLMESELWPRMLHECRRAGVPVAVVNARVSDRSFARGIRVRSVWRRVLRMVPLWLVQSEEDARRLVAMGADAASVQVSGNLKFDVRAARESPLVRLVDMAAAGRPVLVAGSTAGTTNINDRNEEDIFLAAWRELPQRDNGGVLVVVAPRHPERFKFVSSIVETFYADASKLESLMKPDGSGFSVEYDVIVLDTIGDLASLYSIADVAFVGGSMVSRGGHNPLEPAQFGVPVVMGPHFENFRGIVAAMQAVDGIRIVSDTVELRNTLQQLLEDRALAEGIGQRGRQVFEAQQGATGRTVAALMAKVRGE